MKLKERSTGLPPVPTREKGKSMDIFTARPQRILGNVALASLLAGVPAGAVMTLVGGLSRSFGTASWLEWAEQIGIGMLLGPFFVFLGGICLMAPTLTVFRFFGCGGPFFVYAISATASLLAMGEGAQFGAGVAVFSLSASVVFCRYAYAHQMSR